jgi:hypothetical protein
VSGEVHGSEKSLYRQLFTGPVLEKKWGRRQEVKGNVEPAEFVTDGCLDAGGNGTRGRS